MTQPVLTSDDDGRLRCGICHYAAMAVWGMNEHGRLVEAEIVNGRPLYVVCVFCKRYWDRCDERCANLARVLGARFRPAPRDI